MSWLYPFAGSSSSHRRHSSRSKDRYGSSYYNTHHSRHSAPSIFNLGGHANRSTTSSIFSLGSSSRRAKPRSGFISRLIRKIKRLFRDIVHYAKRHPIKVFLLVIMPLITGGLLQKLLGPLGIRLPRALGGGHHGHNEYARGGGGGGEGLSESVNGLVSLAKMFM